MLATLPTIGPDSCLRISHGPFSLLSSSLSNCALRVLPAKKTDLMSIKTFNLIYASINHAHGEGLALSYIKVNPIIAIQVPQKANRSINLTACLGVCHRGPMWTSRIKNNLTGKGKIRLTFHILVARHIRNGNLEMGIFNSTWHLSMGFVSILYNKDSCFLKQNCWWEILKRK